jgi:GTP:adenosylcobinamide-phosphate guanylyltransferase
MDAVVTAGGIPLPGEPLYPFTQGGEKALLDVAGKPMIQWVLDALDDSKVVERLIIMGLENPSVVHVKKPVWFEANHGSLLENIRGGVKKALEIDPAQRHIMLVSSDIPAIQPAMVDWVGEAAMQTDDDVYYNVIEKKVMEKRFPGSKRSYTHLKNMDLAGGDLNVIRAMTATSNDEMWERIIDARKSVFKQAALVGYDVLILLLLRLIDLDGAVKMISRRLKIKGRVLVCPYAEVGMDVDKPHQLEIMRADLASSSGV